MPSFKRAYYKWRSNIFLSVGIMVFALVLLPRIGDLAIGSFKKNNGCIITHIVDGDTVTLRCEGGKETRTRIVGYDTAELSASCLGEWVLAVRAKWALRLMVWRGSEIETDIRGKDHYDRMLARISIDGKDVGDVLVTRGLARVYDSGPRKPWCNAK